ncbi:hypothetical protein ACFWPV_07975 [Streptomyces uncialis]|uniref:hypothetical protein n=1 Tax=Streptomyces uncialis TaxID=1048205 RepID=UPI0036566CF5
MHHLDEPRRAEPGLWPKWEAALAVVNRDLTATLPGQDPLILMLAPSGEPLPRRSTDRDRIHIAMPDGRWHGNPVNSDLEEDDPPEPDDATTVLAVVADAAQETVMELLWQVWPLCPAHTTGMHPRPAGTTDSWCVNGADSAGPPVWWCGGGQDGKYHDVSPVGELAAALPGSRHHAPRRGERDGRPATSTGGSVAGTGC